MKKLYKIGHVISELNVTARTIRYYDQLGILPEVKRSEGGVRLFDDEDIQILKNILTLKAEDKSLDDIKTAMTKKPTQQTIQVVTNSLAYHHTLSKHITVLPFEIQNNKVKINPKLSTFWSSITTKKWLWKLDIPKYQKKLDLLQEKNPDIILYLYANNTPETLQKIIFSDLHNKFTEVIKIPINSVGFSSTLMINTINTTIQNKKSPLDHSSIIKQQEKTPHEIICINSLDFQLTGQIQQKSKTLFSNKLRSLFPIFQNTPEDQTLTYCAICEDEVIEKMIDLFLKELQNRSNYVQKITINYSYHYRLAQKLAKIIGDHIDTAKYSIEETKPENSLECGEKFVCIAMI